MTTAQAHTFDWAAAIARNRAALLRIVSVLFAYAGLDAGGADKVPRRVWRRIVRLLRPAEAAARRLIVIAARGIEVKPPKPRAEKEPAGIERPKSAGVLVFHEINLGLACAPWRDPAAVPPKSPPRLPAIPAFRLTDPPRRFDKKAWDGLRPFPKDGFDQLDPDEDVSARQLCRRIVALKRALDDIDGHARRLARWKARRGARRITRQSPLRPGHPPGHWRRQSHAVHDVLQECHGLARAALKSPDTS